MPNRHSHFLGRKVGCRFCNVLEPARVTGLDRCSRLLLGGRRVRRFSRRLRRRRIGPGCGRDSGWRGGGSRTGVLVPSTAVAGVAMLVRIIIGLRTQAVLVRLVVLVRVLLGDIDDVLAIRRADRHLARRRRCRRAARRTRRR